MHAQRLATKLFTRKAVTREDLHPFIGLFHHFIQEAAVPGLLIDVADYVHVPDGPGVMLIGHDVDYGLDLIGGHSGLLTVRKRAEGVELPAMFRDTLARGFAAALAIEASGEVDVAFDPSVLQVQVLDRRVAPNTKAAADLVAKELEPVVRAVFGGDAHAERSGSEDPRAMLTLRIEGAKGTLAELAARVEKA